MLGEVLPVLEVLGHPLPVALTEEERQREGEEEEDTESEEEGELEGEVLTVPETL